MRFSITLVAAALLLASPLNAAPAGNAPLPSDSSMFQMVDTYLS